MIRLRSSEPWRTSPEGCTTSEAPKPSSKQPTYTLEIGGPNGTQRRNLLLGERITLGCGSNACVRIEDELLNREHCALRATEHGVEVDDLGSKTGILVGGAKVTSALLLDTEVSFVIGRTSVVLTVGETEDVWSESETLPGVIGGSLSMRRVALEVRRHAKTRMPILLLGESGTGKDVLARAIHTQSARKGAYVPLNAGAIPETIADAELFGHRRGAFTGAVASRVGAFEHAHGGTLFLDEVAELSNAMQIKLLRVVEDGAVRPLGAVQAHCVDARVVSATWAPLDEWAENGRFRFDLYQRLSTVVIGLPPLRRRKGDIPALANHLLFGMQSELGEKRLSSQALARLMSYRWPGNVRELATVLYRAAAATPGSEVMAREIDFPRPIRKAPRCSETRPQDAAALLKLHAGNVSAAARAAQVPRSTFRAWLSRSAAKKEE